MKNYLVLYRAPAAVLEEWMKKSPEERKEAEGSMRAKWQAWAGKHAAAIRQTAGAGKTRRVTKEGIEETTNDIMMFSIVEAESPEAVSEMFEHHPHLGIPEASIEIMPVNHMPGME